MSRKSPKHMTPAERLARIAEIIETVDGRCMAADGPVTPTHREISAGEILNIYLLATAVPEKFKLRARGAAT